MACSCQSRGLHGFGAARGLRGATSIDCQIKQLARSTGGTGDTRGTGTTGGMHGDTPNYWIEHALDFFGGTPAWNVRPKGATADPPQPTDPAFAATGGPFIPPGGALNKIRQMATAAQGQEVTGLVHLFAQRKANLGYSLKDAFTGNAQPWKDSATLAFRSYRANLEVSGPWIIYRTNVLAYLKQQGLLYPEDQKPLDEELAAIGNYTRSVQSGAVAVESAKELFDESDRSFIATVAAAVGKAIAEGFKAFGKELLPDFAKPLVPLLPLIGAGLLLYLIFRPSRR